jgi:hypothetical protein
MLTLTRPRLALVAALAVVPFAVAAPVALADSAAASVAVSQGVLDTAVTLILTLLETVGLTSTVIGLIDDLSSGDLTELLGAADSTQLTQILGVANPTAVDGALGGLTGTQLTGVLGALTTGQLTSLLGVADAGELTTILGGVDLTDLSGALSGLDAGSLTAILTQLTPTQIEALLADGASPTSLITGLEGVLGNLGADPSAGAVDGLLAQLNGLLAGGLPTNSTQLGQLSSLLGGVTPLLSTSGLSTSMLTTLLATAQGALADAVPGLDTSAVTNLITELTSLLGLDGGGGTGGGGTGGGGTTGGGTTGGGTTGGGTTGGGTTGGGTTGGGLPGGGLTGTGPGAGVASSKSGHATITRVQRKGNVLIVTLRCTASAGRKCGTTVTATQGGKQKSHVTTSFRGGSTKQVKLHLKATAVAAMTRSRHAVAVKITARTGSYRTSKTLR